MYFFMHEKLHKSIYAADQRGQSTAGMICLLLFPPLTLHHCRLYSRSSFRETCFTAEALNTSVSFELQIICRRIHKYSSTVSLRTKFYKEA